MVAQDIVESNYFFSHTRFPNLDLSANWMNSIKVETVKGKNMQFLAIVVKKSEQVDTQKHRQT